VKIVDLLGCFKRLSIGFFSRNFKAESVEVVERFPLGVDDTLEE